METRLILGIHRPTFTASPAEETITLWQKMGPNSSRPSLRNVECVHAKPTIPHLSRIFLQTNEPRLLALPAANSSPCLNPRLILLSFFETFNNPHHSSSTPRRSSSLLAPLSRLPVFLFSSAFCLSPHFIPSIVES